MWTSETEVFVPKQSLDGFIRLEKPNKHGVYHIFNDNKNINEYTKVFHHAREVTNAYNTSANETIKLLEKHGISKEYINARHNCNWVFIIADSETSFKGVVLETDGSIFYMNNVTIDMTKITLSNGSGSSLVFQTQDLNKWKKDNTTLDMTNALPYDNGNLKKGKDVLKAIYSSTVYKFICNAYSKLEWTDGKEPEKPPRSDKDLSAVLAKMAGDVENVQGSPASYGLVGGTGQHVI